LNLGFLRQALHQIPARLNITRSTASTSAEVTAFTTKQKGAADSLEYRLFFQQSGEFGSHALSYWVSHAMSHMPKSVGLPTQRPIQDLGLWHD